jgi:hypothetical protein
MIPVWRDWASPTGLACAQGCALLAVWPAAVEESFPTMPASKPATRAQAGSANLLWDLLTFDRLMTGPLVHLIYWCGLGLISLFGFTVVGAAVGVAIRSGSLEGILLAVPVLVGGFLVLVAMALLWRGACEFYMAVLRIAEDLRAIRIGQAKNIPPTAPLSESLGGGLES